MGPPSQLTFQGKASRWETGEIKATSNTLVSVWGFAHMDTAISRKVVGKSSRDNPERYNGWF